MSDIDRLTAAIDRLTAVIDKHLEIERMQAETIGQLAKMLTTQESLRAAEISAIVRMLGQRETGESRADRVIREMKETADRYELQKQNENAGEAEQ